MWTLTLILLLQGKIKHVSIKGFDSRPACESTAAGIEARAVLAKVCLPQAAGKKR